MKKFKSIATIVIVLVVLPLQAQVKQSVSDKSKISVTGTSTIHDWEMEVNTIKSSTHIVVEEQEISISDSKVTFQTSDLKSSNSGLNNKAYEALNTKKHSAISFKQNGTVSTPIDSKKFNVIVSGELTIAGQTKPVELKTEGTIMVDGSVRIKGSVDKKMSDFGVTPPKAMMGAIKSGDDINILFEVVYK